MLFFFSFEKKERKKEKQAQEGFWVEKKKTGENSF